MSEPTLRYSLGDVIDRLTILIRKTYFGEEAAYDELVYLETGLTKDYALDGRIISSIVRLAQMNFEIWNLENLLRKGEEGTLSKEDIADRALQIRDLNKLRIRHKNTINEISQDGFVEYKIKHRSA